MGRKGLSPVDRSDTDPPAPGKGGVRAWWRDRLRDVPAFASSSAVVVVVVTAVLATVMVTLSEREADRQQAVSQATVPQIPPQSQPSSTDGPAAAAARLGAGPACGNCGVIESVAMNDRRGGYRMRIRMDDGSVRTVEQRDALIAGARVVLEGKTVRVVPGSPQG